MKIIQQINDEEFIISMADYKRPKKSEERIVVAHDYVRFFGTTALHTDGSVRNPIEGRHAFCANCIIIPTDVTFSIRGAQKVMMDALSTHKYMQPNHLEDREHTKDDAYWNHEMNKELNLTGPRFKKGQKYPAYAMEHDVIIYDDNGSSMVSFRRPGEANYSRVTLGVYRDLIEPRL